MSEKFTTQSYEDRESSKVGVGEYLRQTVVWGLGPLAAGAVGFFAARSLKGVINKPNIQPLIEKAGAGLGTFIAGYHAWHENTAKQKQVTDIVEQAQVLREMESPNTYLERENEQLRRQLQFTTLHPSRTSQGTHVEQLQAEDAVAHGMSGRK
jgi:hypothetical protein